MIGLVLTLAMGIAGGLRAEAQQRTVARGPEAACKVSYQALAAVLKRYQPASTATAVQCYTGIGTMLSAIQAPSADCVRASRTALGPELKVILGASDIGVGLDPNGTLKDAYWEAVRAKARAMSVACANIQANWLNAAINARR